MQWFARYGDLLIAWQESLDRSGTGRVSVEEVKMCLQELGRGLSAVGFHSSNSIKE